ncbi:MAG: restriction endonuclease subunit S [Candidatus Ancillula sp.]|jgi:type I restriction enzyme S subunit|nr:restriction endonuclease subunit S [Candidatus Ancillula sp.]
MSKIDELIQELCPDGVEYLPFGDFVSMQTGQQLNRSKLSDSGTYPVMNGGIFASGYWDEYNIDENTIIASQGGAFAGFVNFMTSKFWAGAHCFVIKIIDDRIVNKYAYYFLKNMQDDIQNAKLGAGIPGLNKKELQSLEIPIPPLPIQRQIVAILDKFDALVNDISAGLLAEIEARQKQYEYYRNQLLAFPCPPTGEAELKAAA